MLRLAHTKGGADSKPATESETGILRFSNVPLVKLPGFSAGAMDLSG